MTSLYEQLMAAKGAPKAASAPNSAQMTSAPMSLRSVMNRFAEGGGVQKISPHPMTPPPPQVSAADINSFVQANLNNPQAIADAAQKYGVNADALANATGYSRQQVNDYFANARLSPFAQSEVNSTPASMGGASYGGTPEYFGYGGAESASMGRASYGGTPEYFGYTQQYTPSLPPPRPSNIPSLSPYAPRNSDPTAELMEFLKKLGR